MNKIRRISYRHFIALEFLLFFLMLIVPGAAALEAGRGDGTESYASPEGNGSFVAYLPVIISPSENEWAMAAANPERTSWTPEEVRGKLFPQWFKPFDAYILPRVQIIAADGLLYVSTAAGLYALDANTGSQVWVYPTEMPLGHSPTIHNGVAYVGGFDRKIHAIDAKTGQGLWTFQAGAGFDTNPLVVGDKLYAGNRDGNFYAIYISGNNKGKQAWKYTTGGPIHFSAAYKDGTVYFASDDSHAYALNAQTGEQVWKSAKLNGAGFHSWWPVIYGDYVIFAGSLNYRFISGLGPGPIHTHELKDIYSISETVLFPRGWLVGPLGTAPGPWAEDTPTVDTSKSNGGTKPVTQYFEEKPYRRTYFVLHRSTGVEYTTDFDNDGKKEYAPILWHHAKGMGNRYPPVVGGDGILYQTNNYMSDANIAGGTVSGWLLGTPYISIISSNWNAVDEPQAFSAGGNMIYWNLCCDRSAGGIDVSIPNTKFAERYNNDIIPATGLVDQSREWIYFQNSTDNGLESIIGDYDIKYYGGPLNSYGVFGNENGIYGYHGEQNPPVPYNGKLYMHRSNAIIAFGPNKVDNPPGLPTATIVSAPDQTQPLSVQTLKDRLEVEVEKILAAGHLRPGYISTGIFDLRADYICGDDLIDYWHHPGDTIATLIQALPHLPADLQAEVRQYIQTEYQNYPPNLLNHIGWDTGAPRETFIMPDDVVSTLSENSKSAVSNSFAGWAWAPHQFYAMWLYAQEFGGALNVYNQAKAKIVPYPSNNNDFSLEEMPHVHNAYILGYYSYLELEKLAGQPESTNVKNWLNTLINLRHSTFTKDTYDGFFGNTQKTYCRALNVSRNFMYMTPELAEIFRSNPSTVSKVQDALNHYEQIAPYWFVSRLEVTFAEGVIHHFYDYHSNLQARALILQQPYNELVNYLDVPGFAVGDMFYIQNLITLIEIGSN